MAALAFEDIAPGKAEPQIDEDLENLQLEDPEPAPPWACSYCGLADPACVAKCVDTGKWFCNWSGGTSGSHLVQHLVRGKHRTVSLHKDSPLGDTVLECYNCGCRNVFVIGFVPAKADSVVVLLCRGCVEGVPSLKSMDWALDEWLPLIADRRFLPWLVREPEERDTMHLRPPTASQIRRLEDLWAKKPDADLNDLDLDEEGQADVEPVRLAYDDGYHYQNVLAPLVKLEADHDKAQVAQKSKEDVSVRWERGLSKKHIAVFRIDDRSSASYVGMSDEQHKLQVGDEMGLRLNSGGIRQRGKKWEATGKVVRYSEGEVALEIRGDCPTTIEEASYIVDFVWKGTSFDRMQGALKTLAVEDASLSGYLYHRLLGHDVEPQVLKGSKEPAKEVPGLPALNPSQASAVRAVVREPLALIQGPPGTGKTVTSAAIVYHMAKQKLGQVLVAAPSNIAVDQLTEKIHATGLKVVRLVAKSKENEPSHVDHLSLHVVLRHVDAPEVAELRKLTKLKEETGDLTMQDLKRFKRLKAQAERAILKAAEVVCCTCVGAGDPRLAGMRFKQVLVDEATQATEAEALVPLVLGAKQLVMVGDHQQLGPVVTCSDAAKAGLGQSLYERLIALGLRPIRLETQYRCHPALSEFPSNMFYEGQLQNGVSANERRADWLAAPDPIPGAEPVEAKGEPFPWPNRDAPMMFYDCAGCEELSASGTSFLNRSEAAAIERVATHFLKAGLEADQLGVITPYEGQRAYVRHHLECSGSLPASAYENVQVASVDAFQGREKDVIILSCVRSNEHQGIGFLSDPRRLNVALTRARYGLILLGNARVLAQDPLWHALLTHMQSKNCLAEGTLANLKPSLVQLPRPRRGGRATENRLRRTALGKPEGYFDQARGDFRDDHWAGDVRDPDYDRENVPRRERRSNYGAGDGFYGGGVPGASNYDDSYGYGGFQSQSQSQAFGGSQGGYSQSQGGYSQSQSGYGSQQGYSQSQDGYGYSQSQGSQDMHY